MSFKMQLDIEINKPKKNEEKSFTMASGISSFEFGVDIRNGVKNNSFSMNIQGEINENNSKQIQRLLKFVANHSDDVNKVSMHISNERKTIDKYYGFDEAMVLCYTENFNQDDGDGTFDLIVSNIHPNTLKFDSSQINNKEAGN